MSSSSFPTMCTTESRPSWMDDTCCLTVSTFITMESNFCWVATPQHQFSPSAINDSEMALFDLEL
ncbi:unnamed protein product [Ceutorhynchus assimilis]|uniref:Uncharacterized protein n=1 Tax=Ceutorhynchus assimilis TaxID=467358 RepID=A0A9N9QI82_9CUCU|nr:unnamed protein product [Ceutorhynchus assimilis]